VLASFSAPFGEWQFQSHRTSLYLSLRDIQLNTGILLGKRFDLNTEESDVTRVI
jgi:hypothetical protein